MRWLEVIASGVDLSAFSDTPSDLRDVRFRRAVSPPEPRKGGLCHSVATAASERVLCGWRRLPAFVVPEDIAASLSRLTDLDGKPMVVRGRPHPQARHGRQRCRVAHGASRAAR